MATKLDVTVRSALSPYGPLVRRSLDVALDCAKKAAAASIPSAWNKSLRANLIWTHATHEFARLTYNDQAVVAFERDGTQLFEVSKQVVIRFKKLGADGRISRIHTKQSDAFFGQGLLFEDRDTCINLVVVYKLDEAEANIESVAFAMSDRSDRVVWRLPVEAAPVLQLERAARQSTTDDDDDLAEVVAKVRKDARRSS